MTRLASLVAAALAVLVVAADDHRLVRVAGADTNEVVVLLTSPPLGEAPGMGSALEAEQRAFRRALAARVPGAEVGW
ncbi:MAG: hypothetical protein OEW47_13680, partial [Thermoleophilia bacterium]|nr:hypothetical protein [Thermoleophilia bacterium]